MHGIETADACPTCRIAATELLHHLPRSVVAELPSLSTPHSIAAGDVLYEPGDGAHAVYILRAGRMKVSSGGQVVKICRTGEVLGGGAVAAGVPHAVTVAALDDCRIDAIALAPAPLGASIVSAVNACALAAHREPRPEAIVLSVDTIARLVRLIAGVGCLAGEETVDGVRVPFTLSHRHIGELLALPETAVTQIFEELEARGVLYADATGITILGSDQDGTEERR